MTDWLSELRLSIRGLARQPIWSLAIVLVLAVGIGANLGMFAGFDAWVLRPLALDRPHELAWLTTYQPLAGQSRDDVSAADLQDWWQAQTSFTEYGAFARREAGFFDREAPQLVFGARITASLLPMLGVAPAIGRGFSTEEDRPGQPAAVALISDRLFRERFDADPRVLGRTVEIDGVRHEIVGVMPRGFRFPEWAEVWTPLGLDPTDPRGSRRLSVIARLRPGVTHELASAELDRIAARLADEYPETNEGWHAEAIPIRSYWVPPVINVALSASLAAGLCVMLIICANVTSLVIARANARSRETALRAALGAGRARLARQLLTETGLLALAATPAGWGIGVLFLHAMAARIPVEPPYLFAMELDARALPFAGGLTLLAAAASTLGAILRTSATQMTDTLRGGGRDGQTRDAGRLRSGLVVAELALSTALIIAAILMVKSFVTLQSADPGYEPAGLVAMDVALRDRSLGTLDQRAGLLERYVEALETHPEIQAADFTTALPVSMEGWQRVPLAAEGAPAEREPLIVAAAQGVSGGYAETLRLALVDGRWFTAGETRNAEPVVVVSTSLAQALWPDRPALGRRVRFGSEDWLRVVGISKDTDASLDMVAANLGQRIDGQLYLPYRRLPHSRVAVVARTDAPLGVAATTLRQELLAASTKVPLSEVTTVGEAASRARWVSRFFSEQLAAYAGLALLIAMLGLFGLVTESTVQRRHELAVRAALGADRRSLVGMVLRRALAMAAPAVAAGCVLALLAARLGSAMLVGVSAFDPQVYGVVGILLLAITALAAWIPARRAAAVEPTAALRAE